MKYAGIFVPLAALGIAVLLLFRPSSEEFYLADLGPQTEAMGELFRIQKQKDLPPEGLFVVNTHIKALLDRTGQGTKENLFLSTYAATHPSDPYLAYYYYEVAENYRFQKADGFAALYYDLVLKNYPDIIYKGNSIHKSALEKLIQVAPDHRTRLTHLNDWTQRFGDPVSLSRMQYYLGQTYEALGEYDKAQEAFKAFLSQPETVIPGDPGAWRRIKEYVDFYRSSKSWVRPTLDSLVSSLKDTFSRVDLRAIEALRSKRGFTVVTWSTLEPQARTDEQSKEFVAAQVRGRAGILISGEFHRDSTDREVYLRSTGWGYSLSPVFYLYLKKVDFLPDPEINGGWEWAGLYMGEKL